MKKTHKAHKQAQPGPAPLPPTKGATGNGRRWILIGIGLLVAAGASWAFMEFVIWNKLPREFVGAWEVVQGPPEYKEAVFEFYRSGKMVGSLNDNGKLRIMNAEVDVDGDKMYVTTRRPSTGEQHVSVQTIRTVNERELVVADERGTVMKMTRVR